jgi:hypothetical protein
MPYSYVINNPLKYTDPTGNEIVGGASWYAQQAAWDAGYQNHMYEYTSWTTFLNSEKRDFFHDVMGPSGGGQTIGEVNMGEVLASLESATSKESCLDFQEAMWMQGKIGKEPEIKAQSGGGASIIYQRTTETDQSTTGSFYIPGTKISGYILEPAGPSTTKSGLDRRIRAGTYNIIKNTGSKYGLRLYNDQVPQSRAILMHIGNYPGDTEGCLLPGSSIGTNFVGGSGPMINQIMNYFNQTGYTGATITIYDIKGP